MRTNKRKAFRPLPLLLAALMLLSACGKAETAAPSASPAEQTAAAKPAVASAADVSLDGLETVEDVRDHLKAVLPREGDGELIPYAADIYHAGENALTLSLFGFCTRSGELVTRPVFSSVSVVRGLAADGAAAEDLYLCRIPAFGCEPMLFTFSGTPADGRRYEELPTPEGLVGGGLGDVIDDGVYCLDGYTMNESGFGEFPDHPGDRYVICRKSDGVKVAETEAPGWPCLSLVDMGEGGRLYYTLLDGMCTTWDRDFRPIVQVPAVGARSVELFENGSTQGEPPAADPAEAGDPFPLSEEQQYAVNLCLSNFSEQRFCEYGAFDHYDSADTSIAQLFRFAHLWCKINRPRALAYQDGYETMSRETFFEIVDPRLDYPADLRPIEGEDYSAALGLGDSGRFRCRYENGRFYYPAGDGESYNRFSVADEAYRINDWTWRFRFTIYELDLDIYWDELGVPSGYYHLSPEEAARRAADGSITAMRTGTAVCTPIYWESSGREMFLLEQYMLDPLD